MRSQAWLLVVAAGLVLVAAAPGGDEAKEDAKKLQGSWEVLEFEVSGKPLPEQFLQKVKVVFAGDKFKFDSGKPQNKDATFKIDPTKKPKQITITSEEKGGKMDLLGIYEFDGDKLKLCLHASGERPTEFKSTPETKSLRMLLKKEKDK
jgi:uncharacterized protein (TIGR03067 family)